MVAQPAHEEGVVAPVDRHHLLRAAAVHRVVQVAQQLAEGAAGVLDGRLRLQLEGGALQLATLRVQDEHGMRAERAGGGDGGPARLERSARVLAVRAVQHDHLGGAVGVGRHLHLVQRTHEGRPAFQHRRELHGTPPRMVVVAGATLPHGRRGSNGGGATRRSRRPAGLTQREGRRGIAGKGHGLDRDGAPESAAKGHDERNVKRRRASRVVRRVVVVGSLVVLRVEAVPLRPPR